jgi:Ca2+/Na+ antiporter
MEKSVKIGWILMLILGLYRIMASISLVTMQQADITAGVNLATTGIAIIFITLASSKGNTVQKIRLTIQM